MCSALSKLKGDILTDTLFPQVKHPGIVDRPCIGVRLSTHDNKFNIVKIALEINLFKQGLGRDAFMLDGELLKDPQSIVSILLILHSAAYDDIVVTVAPIIGDTLHESLYPLGQE